MTDDELRTLEPLLDAHPAPVLIVRGRNFIFVNRALCDLVGQTREQFVGRPIAEAIESPNTLPEEERARMRAIHQQRLAGAPAEPFHFKVALPGGGVRPFRVAYTAMLGGDVVAYLMDDTAEDRLAQIANRLSAAAAKLARLHDIDEICQAAMEAVWAEGLGGAVLLREGPLLIFRAVAGEPEVIEEASAGAGRPLIGAALDSRKLPMLAKLFESGRTYYGGNAYELVEKLHAAPKMRATGRSWFAMLALRGAEGVIGTMTVSSKEMSPAMVGTLELFVAHLSAALENAKLFAELGSARAQLLVSERLAAVGETAAVLAHELRNSLAVLYNGLAMLRQETGDKATTMASMQEEAERLNRLLSDLLDFSRPLSPQLETVSVGALAESAMTLASRTLAAPDSLPVQLDLGDGPREIRVDQNMVCHALANLLVNASQSSQGKTAVRMVARRKGAGVAIDVEDQGEGIPAAVLPRLFQPFFTTRPRGTGLGLALVQKIAAAHGGQASAENLPGHGARFSLWLPA